jgi:hypothetical protein
MLLFATVSVTVFAAPSSIEVTTPPLVSVPVVMMLSQAAAV